LLPIGTTYRGGGGPAASAVALRTEFAADLGSERECIHLQLKTIS